MTAEQNDLNAVLEKIANLLRLSQSDNEHEAELAMKHAQRLMLKHNIDEHAARDAAGQEAKTRDDIVEMRHPFSSGVAQEWETQLGGVVANAYFCKHLFYPATRGHKPEHLIVGRRRECELAHMAFHAFWEKLQILAVVRTSQHTERLKARWGVDSIRGLPLRDDHPKRYRTDWLKGCIEGLRKALKENMDEQPQSKELMVIRGNEITVFLEKYGRISSHNTTTGRRGQGFTDGYNEGRQMGRSRREMEG
jgi:hypothetical protein